MIDLAARERHFADHLAPVWRALPVKARGRFLVVPDLIPYTNRLGISAESLDDADPGHAVLVASWGDLNRVRQRGWQQRALMEHGIGQSFGGDPDSADFPNHPGGGRRHASLFLSPNAHAAGRDQAAYPAARVEIVGCPKLDDLPKREPGPGPVVAFAFHWSGKFAETSSGFGDFAHGVAALASTYSVIGHAHPKDGGVVGAWCVEHGIPFVPDFADVCRQADLYVSEGVSTLYEFASTGRPVVVLNPAGYRQDKNHGLRFESDGRRYVGAANVGVQVDAYGPGSRSARLAKAVARGLADGPEQRANREAALDIVYAYRTGAAKRAARVLVDWAGAKQRRAA